MINLAAYPPGQEVAVPPKEAVALICGYKLLPSIMADDGVTYTGYLPDGRHLQVLIQPFVSQPALVKLDLPPSS